MTDAQMVAFLMEAARFFDLRVLTCREDGAHWASVFNAENLRKIAARLEELSTQK